jgi:NAD(P)-dependent dehydrogenase (short-subunit alcohol dehydrogenase family)
MSHEMSGRTALVTGATAGTGEAVARQLARLDVSVVVHGRDADRGTDVVRNIEADGGSARFVAADLSQPSEAHRLAEAAGAVDILVNNADIYLFGSTADTDGGNFDAHLAVNLRAPFILVRELAPGMVDRGRGAIVNVSTFGASVAGRGGGAYGASKAGLELLTKIWADEFEPSGVRVNAVSAGPTRTPGTAVYGDLAAGLGTVTTLGRIAGAEEIANAIVFLTTPVASYISGAVLPAHGGLQAIAPR